MAAVTPEQVACARSWAAELGESLDRVVGTVVGKKHIEQCSEEEAIEVLNYLADALRARLQMEMVVAYEE